MTDRSRYSRQLVLPQVGTDGQRRIRASRVACVGVGGLGSPAALYLAAAGVGSLKVIDPDRVSLSNLQRQVLFDSRQAGEPKALMASERLSALNPECRVEAVPKRFSAREALALLEGVDLVIDGTDNFPARFLVNDAAARAGIPLVHGAIRGFDGQAALFHSARGPCYRCLHPRTPDAPVASCAEAGILGPVAGVIGSLQATLALRFIVSGGDPAHPLAPVPGELVIADLARGRFETIRVPRRSACPVCSVPRESIELREEGASCADAPAEMTWEDLRARLSPGKDAPLLIDVREADELALVQDSEHSRGVPSGALAWPLSRLEAGELPPLGLSRDIVLVCRSGIRSARALKLLAPAAPGRRLYSLAGGWSAAGR